MPVERIGVVPFDAVGHMNPQIALVSSFLTRGAKLRFYLSTPQFKSTIEDLGEGGEGISSLVLSDTEDVHLLTSPPAADGSDDNISDLTIGICSHTLQTLPKMLEVSLLNLFLALLLDSDLGALTRTSGRSSPM